MNKEYETICRLCLEKSDVVRPVTSKLCDSTIALVLKSFIPELYLGVSVLPVICNQCFSILLSFQKFRQKCLEGEYLIGVYLRETKCTALSIKLADVLDFWKAHKKVKDTIQKTQKEIEDEQKESKEAKATSNKRVSVLKPNRPKNTVSPKLPYAKAIFPDTVPFVPNRGLNNGSPLNELSRKDLLTECPSADTVNSELQKTNLIKPADKGEDTQAGVEKTNESVLGYLASEGDNVSGYDSDRNDLEAKNKKYFEQSEAQKSNESTVIGSDSCQTMAMQNRIPNLDHLEFCTETGAFVNKKGEAFDSFGNPVDVLKPIVIPPDPKPQTIVYTQSLDIENEQPAMYIYKNKVNNVATNINLLEQPPVLSPQAIIPSNNVFKFAISSIQSLQGETIESISYINPVITPVEGPAISYISAPKEKATKKQLFVVKKKDIKNLTGYTLLNVTDNMTPATGLQESPQRNLDNPRDTDSPMETVNNEDLIDIKEEPLDIDESETSFYENLARESGLNNLLSIIPEGETHYDVPEYVHINNVSYEDLNRLKQESEAYTRSIMLDEQNIVRNPAASRGSPVRKNPVGLKAAKLGRKKLLQRIV